MTLNRRVASHDIIALFAKLQTRRKRRGPHMLRISMQCARDAVRSALRFQASTFPVTSWVLPPLRPLPFNKEWSEGEVRRIRVSPIPV